MGNAICRYPSRSHLIRVWAFLLSAFGLASMAIGQIPYQLDVHGNHVPATLPHMYQYVFHLQNEMDKLADQKQGASSEAIRDSLRVHLQLNEQQFALFREASIHLNDEEQRILTAKPGTNGPPPGQGSQSLAAEEMRSGVHPMYAAVDQAASDEVDRLHKALGPKTSSSLDAAVVEMYSNGQRGGVMGTGSSH